MTKEELKQLVDFIYTLWNQPPPTTQKQTYETWWTLLNDLPYQTAHQAAINQATLDGPLPRPATIRRTTINLQGTTPPPTPIEAWNTLQQLREAQNNGTHQPTNTHPLIKATIQKTGTNLHTNGDREQFIKTYLKETEQWELKTYSPKTAT